MNAEKNEAAAPALTGWRAEFPGRMVMQLVPRNVDGDAKYKLAKPYAPRVPECIAAYKAVLEVLDRNGGTATGWELHKACQGLDGPFFGFRVRAGTFVKVDAKTKK